ncbi:MAG: TetR/AcrR family transcriptional regulator [Micropepsaceae bacterium]
MGRLREFDEDAVLTGAMEAFRRHGFGGVSVRDLEQATGLKAGSIYNSYGDKTGLFDAAMAHYNVAVLRQRIEEHVPEAAGLKGLRRFFLTLLLEPGGASLGCLITNSAVEFGGGRTLPAHVTGGLRILSDVFALRLKVWKRTGEIAADLMPEVAATRLLALYQGILVLVRAGWDKPALKKMIQHEFDRLGDKR